MHTEDDMKQIVSLTLLFALALSLCACGGGADPAAMEESEWQLVSLDGSNPLPNSTVTLAFPEGELAGSAGCNSYGGPYSAQRDGSFEPGMVFSTLIACPSEDVMEQEARYLGLLTSARTWELAEDGSWLELRTPEGQTLRYRPLPPEPTASLEGTRWLLSSFSDGMTERSLITGSEISLELEGGELSGSAGCNSYGGSYTAGEGALDVGMLFNTEMACLEPEGLMDQESEYLSILGAATSFQIDGSTLRISTDDGLGLSYTAEQ
jgi:heat shock protein HslJ